ncbi:hypothetical protein ABPG74_014150 [Tetrahymena malaccensis]
MNTQDQKIIQLDLSKIDFTQHSKFNNESEINGDGKSIMDKNLENKTVNLYDLVKIKVTLNDNYYIFSRYLISRMLTLIYIDKQTAASIAKSIKKKLVEKEVKEINQNQLEEILFETIYQQIPTNPAGVIGTYKIVSEFYRMRTPIVILIFGAPKIGKSNIANQLADKMNISNVLQTDIISCVMEMMHVGDSKQNHWNDMNIDLDETIKRYEQRCYQVRKGANTDIQKCLSQGKPVIIEGTELNPSFFLKIKNQDEQIMKSDQIQQKLSQYIEGSIHERDILDDYSIEQDSQNIQLFQPEPQEWESAAEKDRIRQAIDYFAKFNQGQLVIVAFHLVISKKQHRFNINNQQVIQKISDSKEREIQTDILLNKFQAIQNHLLHKCSLSCTIPIDINCQQHTLDTVQKILLKNIENWYYRTNKAAQEKKEKQ